MVDYENTANTLVNRILALIPNHPEIMKMTNPSLLHKIEDFDCNDIGPSMFQAQWALARAKQEYKEQENGKEKSCKKDCEKDCKKS